MDNGDQFGLDLLSYLLSTLTYTKTYIAQDKDFYMYIYYIAGVCTPCIFKWHQIEWPCPNNHCDLCTRMHLTLNWGPLRSRSQTNVAMQRCHHCQVYLHMKFERVTVIKSPTMDLNTTAKPNCWCRWTSGWTMQFNRPAFASQHTEEYACTMKIKKVHCKVIAKVYWCSWIQAVPSSTARSWI